jgi:hypothetical protein
MTNLCIVRVAGGVATSLTGKALVFLDRVGGGSGGEAEGHEVVLHVIHVFRASSSIHLLPWFSLLCCSKVPSRGFTLRLYYDKHVRTCADRSDPVEQEGHRARECCHGRVQYISRIHLSVDSLLGVI